jgi:hypothetical protein
MAIRLDIQEPWPKEFSLGQRVSVSVLDDTDGLPVSYGATMSPAASTTSYVGEAHS